MADPAKADWTLFQSLLPQWQERFMSRLCDKYAAVLTGPYRGSEAFWEVKRFIRQDVKRFDVMGELEQSEVACIIADLLREQVITTEGSLNQNGIGICGGIYGAKAIYRIAPVVCDKQR